MFLIKMLQNINVHLSWMLQHHTQHFSEYDRPSQNERNNFTHHKVSILGCLHYVLITAKTLQIASTFSNIFPDVTPPDPFLVLRHIFR